MIDLTCFNWIKMVQKSKLPPHAKYLAHYLSTFMNQHNDLAYPSQARMVAETGMAKSTVNKYLNELDQKGWLRRDRGNSTTNTTYYISIPTEAIQDVIGGSPTDGLRSTSHGLGSSATRTRVVRHTDTNNNVITNNNKRFVPPTLEEVKAYAREKSLTIDAQDFIDFYESKGWLVGKSPMKKWQAAASRWARSNQPTKSEFKGL